MTQVLHADETPFVLGGDTLRRFPAEVVLTLPAPMPTLTGTTAYYVDPGEAVIFEGESRIDILDDGDRGESAVPTRLIRRGEPGFASPEPDPDCDPISSRPVTMQEHAWHA